MSVGLRVSYLYAVRQAAVAVVVVLSAACGGSATRPSTPAPLEPASPPPGVLIVGAISDYTTGAAIPGVTVTFGDQSAVSGSGGVYSVRVPDVGRYQPTVDGAPVGLCEVTRRYRGDFLLRAGTCVGRYGTVSDGQTLTPLAGATVTLGRNEVVTGTDGWYRIELGCPSQGYLGISTTFITASHPGYADRSIVAGKGIAGFSRIDLQMQPR